MSAFTSFITLLSKDFFLCPLLVCGGGSAGLRWAPLGPAWLRAGGASGRAAVAAPGAEGGGGVAAPGGRIRYPFFLVVSNRSLCGKWFTTGTFFFSFLAGKDADQ